MLTIFVILMWLILSVIVGELGRTRNIGFKNALLISIFFTPLAGFLATLCTRDTLQERREIESLRLQFEILLSLNPDVAEKLNEVALLLAIAHVESLKAKAVNKEVDTLMEAAKADNTSKDEAARIATESEKLIAQQLKANEPKEPVDYSDEIKRALIIFGIVAVYIAFAISY